MSQPIISAQHRAARVDRRQACQKVVSLLAGLRHIEGLQLVDMLDVVEAGVAEFLRVEGIDTREALGSGIAVTILLTGEVATDILPHLLPKQAA